MRSVKDCNHLNKDYCNPDLYPDSSISDYIGSVDEDHEYYRWKFEVDNAFIITSLNEKYKIDATQLIDIKPINKGPSGRIYQLDVIFRDKYGIEKSIVINSEYKIRDLMSKSFLFSSAFSVKKDGEKFILHGKGWGHGVGLCQIGALGMSLSNKKSIQILSHYFPETEVRKNLQFMNNQSKSKAWAWVPSLYFAEGLPYAFVMIVSVVLYKKLDISNSEIALYTSWLYLPWVIKPFWSPFIDLIKTKRYWIILTQLIVGASLAGIAFSIPTDSMLQYTLAFFWLMAFSSSTHDIAADGFYMLGLSNHNQSWFIGIRNSFYRLAILFSQGILVILAGQLENFYGNVKIAWATIFGILSIMFLFLAFYHRWALPLPQNDKNSQSKTAKIIGKKYLQVVIDFFNKPKIILIIIFILLYRFGEAQLVKIAPLFMLDSYESGGLNLSTSEYGFIYGTLGVAMLTLGGIAGGFFIARNGLRYWIVWMALAMKLPDLVYVYMAYSQPSNLTLISLFVSIEQFGYGFGFTAYLLYMMMVSEGEHKQHIMQSVQA